MSGWEGTAHDSKVLSSAFDHGFPVCEGKYYLGDAGYALQKFVLVPYRGVRYHLNEWANNDSGPKNAKELYNLRHSSLRNIIERSFGILKKRFGLLNQLQTYTYGVKKANSLILCAFAIHTFIRSNNNDNRDGIEIDYDNNLKAFRMKEGLVPSGVYAVEDRGGGGFYDGSDDSDYDSDGSSDDDLSGISFTPPNTRNGNSLKKWRDGIAKEMWDDYIAYKKAEAAKRADRYRRNEQRVEEE